MYVSDRSISFGCFKLQSVRLHRPRIAIGAGHEILTKTGLPLARKGTAAEMLSAAGARVTPRTRIANVLSKPIGGPAST
jgi:hypothetical protein